jgi:putative spermidine/putrescine transport system ATP-binding protein
MTYLTVSNLSKHYKGKPVFDGIDLTVAEGELVTLLGPSGCGKSTLLRCIAGLETPDGGRIGMAGHDITRVAAQRRGIGMVFQNYALFPNLTVEKNIAFGLEMQGIDLATRIKRVAELVELTQLGGHEHELPAQLSGGQRQRVALARALAPGPRILLLDEPLSALDARIRRSLQEELRRLQAQLSLTTIFVTHDQEEALRLSDRIVVLDGGRIVQQGTAETIYTRPTSAFVARFIGNYNLLDAAQAQRLLGLAISGQLAIRPEAIRIATGGAGAGQGGFVQFGPACPARVRDHQLLGGVIRYRVEARGCLLMVDMLNRGPAALLAPGAPVELLFDGAELREVGD